MSTPPEAYDVAAVRACVPALAHGAAHFDSPGGTQTPVQVAEAVSAALTSPLSNRGRLTRAERNADDLVTGCRAALGDLLGVAADTVVVGRSMTEMTFEVSRCLAERWRPGDEVVVSRLDHDANVRPWMIAAERRGVRVRFADFDASTSELEVGHMAALLTPRTVLVAVTAASNLLGTMPDVRAIADAAHAVGALVFVDGVHFTAHAFVDVPGLGADLYACSPYKFLGPHLGVLTGRADLLDHLKPDKLLPAADGVPERFERGTLPYELMAGTTAAVDFLAGLSGLSDLSGSDGSRRTRLRVAMDRISAHEHGLQARIEGFLAARDDVVVQSRAARRTSTLLLTFAHHEAAVVSRHLAAAQVNAPSGAFYAHETALHLGLGTVGGLRIGLAPYNDEDDVDRLLAALTSALARRADG